MKFTGFGLICLLCTVAWAAEDEVAKPILQIFTEKNDKYGLGLYNKVSWYEAQQICASEGFTLVSIPSAATQTAINSFIRSSDSVQYIANEPIWTSGTNQAVSTRYVWQSSGAAVNYKNFNPSASGSNRCIGIIGNTGFWSSLDCRDRHYFICEQKQFADDC